MLKKVEIKLFYLVTDLVGEGARDTNAPGTGLEGVAVPAALPCHLSRSMKLLWEMVSVVTSSRFLEQPSAPTESFYPLPRRPSPLPSGVPECWVAPGRLLGGRGDTYRWEREVCPQCQSPPLGSPLLLPLAPSSDTGAPTMISLLLFIFNLHSIGPFCYISYSPCSME